MKAAIVLKTLCAGATFAMASVAIAEQAPEEIVVTGKYGRMPDSVQSLSQAVSYADLDITTDAGKNMLKHRVRLTSRWLCEKLGEPDVASPPVPSCQDAAVRDAMARVGTIEQNTAPRGTTWVAGKAWQAPYPSEWEQKYP